MFSRGVFAVFLVAGCLNSIEAQDSSQSEVTRMWLEEGLQKIKKTLPQVRLAEEDLQLSRGWTLPLSIPAIQNFFKKPFLVATDANDWASKIEFGQDYQSIYNVPFELLTDKDLPLPKIKRKKFTIPKKIPLPLHDILNQILTGLDQATPHLNKAVASVSKEDRLDFLQLYEWPKEESGKAVVELSSRRKKAKYKAMEQFDQDSLLKAGHILFETLDKTLPEIETLIKESFDKPIRWKTMYGDILIAGSGNDVYQKSDLDNVVLLLDLGGKNAYRTPMAVAYENEIRIVIDLGNDIEILTSENHQPTAGVGVYGIGLVVLPNEEGTKLIDGKSFSQGVGLGGIGAALLSGNVHLHGGRYVQGAGIFGVGILDIKNGDNSTLSAERNGQGLGMVRGVGILSAKGNEIDIKGGLVEPDPREPQGAVSLCQGVGFGPRAYSGGGAGIAVLSGNKNKVRGSYFSQGVGYWKAIGVFRIRGDENILQARRYDQGTGVHSAFGHFQLLGNKNRILNWGVGPAYGWDISVGSALIVGDDNELQASWGSGTAAIGSYSYSYLKGNNFKIKYPQFAQGRSSRRSLAYAVHVMEGSNNTLERKDVNYTASEPAVIAHNPWGVFQLNQIEIVEDLKLQPIQWPELVAETVLERETIDLQNQIKTSEEKPARDRISDLVDVAAAFSVDKDSPREAFIKLLRLKTDEIPELVEIFEPAGTDQLIRLWPLMATYGEPMAKAILKKFDDQTLRKKATLLRQLGLHHPRWVIPKLFSLVNDKRKTRESRVLRHSAIQSVVTLLNSDVGQEPGSRGVLKLINEFLTSKKSKKLEKNLHETIVRLRPQAAYGLFSTLKSLTEEERISLFESFHPDITEKIGKKGADEVLRIIKENKKSIAKETDEALSRLKEAEQNIRPPLYELLESTQATHIALAVKLLGQINYGEDIERISPKLTHDSGRVREAAAVALGQMGEPALPFLTETLATGSSLAKKLVMASIPHAVTRKASLLVKTALRDENAQVRLAATSVLRSLPPALKKDWKKIKKLIKKIQNRDEDPSIRLAGSLIP